MAQLPALGSGPTCVYNFINTHITLNTPRPQGSQAPPSCVPCSRKWTKMNVPETSIKRLKLQPCADLSPSAPFSGLWRMSLHVYHFAFLFWLRSPHPWPGKTRQTKPIRVQCVTGTPTVCFCCIGSLFQCTSLLVVVFRLSVGVVASRHMGS